MKKNWQKILKQSLDNTDVMKDATRLFSKRRADESKALVQISRELDRPGLLGVVTFILPLVIDSIFNKLAPKVFSPNTIAMLQKRENSFCGIRRRKRLERLGQFTILATFFSALIMGVRQLIRILSRVTGQRNTTVTMALVGCAVAIAFVKKLAVFLVPGLAPADVLNKAPTGQRIAEDDQVTHSNIAGEGI